jgi:hypothetical protein
MSKTFKIFVKFQKLSKYFMISKNFVRFQKIHIKFQIFQNLLLKIFITI